MVEEEQTDPLEITKEPEIVKTAQQELSKVDVLVCGECHEVFHFIEQFQEHKGSDKCTKESVLKQGSQAYNKQQIWGFLLWKNAKFKTPIVEENPPSSWNVYQLWCNLDQTQKDSWIAAGKSLQSIHTITAETLTPKPVNKQVKVKLLNKKSLGDEDLNESDIKEENDPLADTESDIDLEEELAKHKLLKGGQCENGGIKKTILKQVELNSDVTILPGSKKGSKKAIRTHDGVKKGEYAVEKIVSKRYNPGKKTHEYMIKWENFPEDQNTWEPVAHLESCKQLVEEFDRHLQRLKAQKISRGSLVQRRPHKKTQEKNADLILTSTGPGRPQRTSKQKALNQVKVWCGNISDADEASSGKRPFSDSDSDSFEKKMKMEEDSSDSDDEVRPPVTVRKVIKAPLNGLSRKQPLPENILVPDAHGVVTINQKQLPALSSGVYVMSKTAGIIKLDSNTSKIAASGGHTVIKVAPKIGQTSIKVVKRGEAIGTAVATGASVVATTATMNNGSKTTPTILNSKYRATMKPLGTKMIAHRRLPTTTVVKKPEPVKVEMPPEEDDDSDDGLEELPFPTDLPLPEPESPPGEFTLCPLTGKVVGQEYPSEEEGDAAVSLKQEVADGDSTIGTTSEYNSLDVLGDISACNILASGESSNAIKMETSDQDVSKEAASAQLKKPQTVESTRTVTSNQEELDKTQSIEAVLSAMEGGDEDSIESGANTNVAASSSSTSSILTTALSNANIEASPQPVAVSTGPTLLRKVEVPEAIRQKTAMNRHIINRTIVPKPAPQAIITRITPGCVNRNKQVLNKQKILGGPPPTTIRKTIRQTYSNKNSPNVIRKISATTVYHQNTTATSTTTIANRESNPSTLTTLASPSISTQSLVETLTSSGTSEVINMPLLTDLETPSTSIGLRAETTPEPTTPVSLPSETELNSISLTEGETPLLITGEDGTIYQVAGQNEDGQTILIAQDADGQQQCLLVASESTSELTEGGAVATPAVVTAEAQEQQLEEPMVINTEPESDTAEDSQIVAQIVSAQPPSPGGTRKVVLMLPDGNLMMTEVTAEQYAALELDK